jgi:hypothetical protein
LQAYSLAAIAELKRDAAAVVTRYFPEAPTLYVKRDWQLPKHIRRVYEPGWAERVLGFRCKTDFSAILRALRAGALLPFTHDPAYVSPAAFPVAEPSRSANHPR